MSIRVYAAALAIDVSLDQRSPTERARVMRQAAAALAAADEAEYSRLTVERRPNGSIVCQGVTYQLPWEDDPAAAVQAHSVLFDSRSSYHQRIRAAAVIDFVLGQTDSEVEESRRLSAELRQQLALAIGDRVHRASESAAAFDAVVAVLEGRPKPAITATGLTPGPRP